MYEDRLTLCHNISMARLGHTQLSRFGGVHKHECCVDLALLDLD